MKEYLSEYDGWPIVGHINGSEVRDAEGQRVHTSDDNTALRWAMVNMPSGVIDVAPGEYEVGRLGGAAKGHLLRGAPGAMIFAPGDDAVFFDRQPERPVMFDTITLMAGKRSAITTHDDGGAETRYRIDLDNCVVDGGFDHAENTGRDSKWGLNIHRWAGSMRRTMVRDTKREHGIYTHSAAGNIYIDGSRLARCGRAGLQHVGREHESGWSPHEIRITDTVIEDCGLRDGGGAITMQGMSRGVLRRVKSYIGRDEEFISRYLETHPDKQRFGATHLVNWDEITSHTPNVNLPSDGIWLDDYSAWTRNGCGNGPAVSVTNAKTLMLTSDIAIRTGGEFDAALKVEGAAIDIAGLRSLKLVRWDG